MEEGNRMYSALTKMSLPFRAVVLVITQIVCAILFLIDLLSETLFVKEGRADAYHIMLEAVLIIFLAVSIAFEWQVGKKLLRRTVVLQDNLDNTSKAVFQMVEAHFDTWGLTPAERDVAGFVVKGMTTAEIAELRGSSEATVKAHLNAVYRKSGCSNRAGMLSNVIDSLVSGRMH
jgi:DNA-binding CsgD family transcriptional regulator